MVPGSGCPHRAVGDLAAGADRNPDLADGTSASPLLRRSGGRAALAARLEGRRPLVLPLAAQVIPERVASFAERAPDLAFLWPWDMSSEHLHHVRVSEIFDVAERYGAVILKTTRGAPSGISRRRRRFVTRVPGYRGALEELQRHRVVVPFDPRTAGSLMVPQIVFDAAAGGNVMLAPYQLGISRLWRYLAPFARNWRDAERQIPQLLTDWPHWTDISNDAREAALNARAHLRAPAGQRGLRGRLLADAGASPADRGLGS